MIHDYSWQFQFISFFALETLIRRGWIYYIEWKLQNGGFEKPKWEKSQANVYIGLKVQQLIIQIKLD